VGQEFESLLGLQHENRLTHRWVNGKCRLEQRLRWVNGIDYTVSAKRGHTVDVIECMETRQDTAGAVSAKKFRWVTNVPVSKRNALKLANDGGRLRWKIENESFNAQKNGGYGLTHVYSKNNNSAQIFHFLMQIAHQGEPDEALVSAGYGICEKRGFQAA
jgi:hypothetical protein